ncbi:class II fructose-bisphosphatase [Streptomyces caeni]|uniref:Fructose-1,6-bisphosphatase n=1 Tax=Streptomyces caeni TaxID=2307231 RepID=A0ABW4J0G1_9ACTN
MDPVRTSDHSLPEHHLALDLVRSTEAAAIAAAHWAGRGDKHSADQAAVDAMRAKMSTLPFNGVVVIGEGEKDEAPMLYNGEAVGDGRGPAYDVAVDPIDGTTLTAKGMSNALSVLAASPRGSMFDPSALFYIDKLVTGPEAAALVDITAPVADNVRAVARGKGVDPGHVTVCMLDRPRHKDLADQVRAAGARVRFIPDGDVAGAVMAAREGTGIDMLLGIGGTPEGIIAACAVKCLGGVLQARWAPRDENERRGVLDAGHDPDRVFCTDDLVTGDGAIFVATGITDGDLMSGVRHGPDRATTESLVMSSRSRTVLLVRSEHRIDPAGHTAPTATSTTTKA